MMDELFEDAKRSIDAVHLQMRNQIKRDLRTAWRKNYCEDQADTGGTGSEGHRNDFLSF